MDGGGIIPSCNQQLEVLVLLLSFLLFSSPSMGGGLSAVEKVFLLAVCLVWRGMLRDWFIFRGIPLNTLHADYSLLWP
jgi:hypothetical protein